MDSKTKNAEVPLFLRKTYHMIDTCDPKVACWSEDGQTFVVKNTDVFEKTIIPQFFKHSKFSSFVRQLNFYGFRKIKYADTIKIDAKLEAETANFWRFRHDKFLRGKPELLVYIKRSNGNPNANSTQASKKLSQKDVEDTSSLKSEVTVLKKRIEAMTKNIDELTSMVKKVTLKSDSSLTPPPVVKEEVGSKRKKVEVPAVVPDKPTSAMMEVDDSLKEIPTFPVPAPLTRRSSSSETNISDDDFVNELFTEFIDENIDEFMEEIPSSNPPTPPPETDEVDPRLMKRLGDALKLVPREMQEMIVDRLVKAITSTEGIEKNVNVLSAMTSTSKKPTSTSVVVRPPVQTGKVAPSQVPPTPTLQSVQQQQQNQLPMGLAAATLAALLAQYTDAIKDGPTKEKHLKPLPPVIPIHA